MKLKKEYLILIVVIAALALYLSLRSTDNGDSDLPRPAAVERAKINRIVITDKANGTEKLVKKDAKWLIEPQGFPADAIKVKNMINAIADLKLTALVSESGNYQRYGLGPDEKISVDAFEGDTSVRKFEIGKAAPTFQHTFVVLDGDPNVYHARGQLKRTFDHTVAALRDKTVFDVSKENVAALTVQKGDHTLVLTRKEIPQPAAKDQEKTKDQKESAEKSPPPPKIEWRDAQGRTVATGSVDQLLGSVARMDCDGYLADADKAALKDPSFQITFKDAQKDYVLSVFPAKEKGADKIPATASANAYPFELNKSRVENLAKSVDKLLGIEEKK